MNGCLILRQMSSFVRDAFSPSGLRARLGRPNISICSQYYLESSDLRKHLLKYTSYLATKSIDAALRLHVLSVTGWITVSRGNIHGRSHFFTTTISTSYCFSATEVKLWGWITVFFVLVIHTHSWRWHRGPSLLFDFQDLHSRNWRAQATRQSRIYKVSQLKCLLKVNLLLSSGLSNWWVSRTQSISIRRRSDSLCDPKTEPHTGTSTYSVCCVS